MAKFKYSEKAILKTTGKEVVISKVIEDCGNKLICYKLSTGENVVGIDLMKLSDVKKIAIVLHKSVNKGKANINKSAKRIKDIADKKESVSAVKHVDEKPINKEIEKSDENSKTD